MLLHPGRKRENAISFIIRDSVAGTKSELDTHFLERLMASCIAELIEIATAARSQRPSEVEFAVFATILPLNPALHDFVSVCHRSIASDTPLTGSCGDASQRGERFVSRSRSEFCHATIQQRVIEILARPCLKTLNSRI
jgi:hypothetical protein